MVSIEDGKINKLEGIFAFSMITAYILLVTEVGKEHDVIKKINGMKSVKEVSAVYGEYDIFTKFVVKDMKELDTVVTEIRKIQNIIRTITLISS